MPQSELTFTPTEPRKLRFTPTPIGFEARPKAKTGAKSDRWPGQTSGAGTDAPWPGQISGKSSRSKPWERYASGAQSDGGFTFTPIDEPAKSPGFKFIPLSSDGGAAVRSVFPGAKITSQHRGRGGVGPESDYHHTSNAAVDMVPIDGMTFHEAKAKLIEAGYPVIEGIDEVNQPSRWSTGPHWHFVLGEREGGHDGKPWEKYASPADDQWPGQTSGTAKQKLKFTLTPIDGGQSKAPQKRKGSRGYSDTPKAQNRAQRSANRPPRPNDDPSLLSAAWLGFKHFPGSAWETVKGIGHAVAHPAEAVEGLGETVGGAGLAAMDALSQKLRGRDFATGPQAKADEAKFRKAVEPYTTWKGAKKQFAEDPVGTALTVLPAAGAAARVAKLGIRGAEAASLAGKTEAERAAIRGQRAEHYRLSTQTKNAFRTVLARHDLDAQRAAHELEQHQRVVGNASVEHQRAIIKAVESASSGGIRSLPEKYRAAAQGSGSAPPRS